MTYKGDLLISPLLAFLLCDATKPVISLKCPWDERTCGGKMTINLHKVVLMVQM